MMVFGCVTLRNPQPETEFRGVWVATVVNIDWPRNGNDSADKQKADFLQLLDFYQNLHFNALIVQVRTAGDALYDSEMAPWSRFLTGIEGMPKEGFERPLQWMIDQTHKRGMQFHAWLNPYRATFDLDTTILAKNHDFYQHRDWMVKYGKKYYYNPGEPKVWQHLSDVVEEVVVNYDIDGIHFDDYFYPYKISGETFNDSLAYSNHKLPDQTIGDWRRANADSLVHSVHKTVKSTKPWVQFGISPFGVWKNKATDPKGSDTKAGQTTYEDLYADPLVWIKNDWLDNIVPQAYWSMEFPAASHSKIVEWWAHKNGSTTLFMGNGAYKIRNNADRAWDKKRELPKQLKLARSTPRVSGNIFFSAKSLPQHEDIVKKIKRNFYKGPIRTPSLAKIAKRTLESPVLVSRKDMNGFAEICLSHYDSVPRYILAHELRGKKRQSGKLVKKVYLPSNDSNTCFQLWSKTKNLGFTVRDAFGNESEMKKTTN